MATRRYKITPGEPLESVTEEAGAAVNSDVVELTVEMAASVYDEDGNPRVVEKQEVIEAIDKLKAHIVKSQWPPV